uniref:WD repeat containing planar cell polarity effector n=1 Tax=Salarias fasciatus TaxID=181472 RepID=A0A672GWF1_SALFA
MSSRLILRSQHRYKLETFSALRIWWHIFLNSHEFLSSFFFFFPPSYLLKKKKKKILISLCFKVKSHDLLWCFSSIARGYSWTPRNRRPEKLRDSLKDLEELLQTNTCIHTRWRSKHCCQVMLSNAVLATLNLNGPQLEQICIDRTLTGRLPAHTATDAQSVNTAFVLLFCVQVVCVDVGGRSREGRRHVSLNCVQDVALCWWNLDQPGEELWTNTHKNNLVLISCSPTDGLKVYSSVRTEGNPLDCCFSLLQPYQIHTVEVPAEPPGLREGSWADACVYECARGRLNRLSVHRISLPSHPISCSRHPSETALLLGLSDSSLVLYDQRRGVSLLAPCPVPPTLLAWHPAGAVVMVGGGQEELMCFDVGLAPVSVALVAEEVAPAATLRLAQHLRCSGGLSGLQWGARLDGGPEGTDVLTLAFHGGPLAALRFRLGALTGGQMGPGEVLQQRLRCGQVREALGVLEAMDWSTMGDECYRGLISVTNHLLRLELNAEREAQLEAALGVFYAPAAPLSDSVIREYREPISKYARRFFHHLLRHQRFEKAFLLAVDLEARDLFMDLHYVASDKGELVLVDVAKRKANEIEARTIARNGKEIIIIKGPGFFFFFFVIFRLDCCPLTNTPQSTYQRGSGRVPDYTHTRTHTPHTHSLISSQRLEGTTGELRESPHTHTHAHTHAHTRRGECIENVCVRAHREPNEAGEVFNSTV